MKIDCTKHEIKSMKMKQERALPLFLIRQTEMKHISPQLYHNKPQ